jgi:hypothetical protein
VRLASVIGNTCSSMLVGWWSSRYSGWVGRSEGCSFISTAPPKHALELVEEVESALPLLVSTPLDGDPYCNGEAADGQQVQQPNLHHGGLIALTLK